MTYGSARCHDHNYDPISQKDFYSLLDFFKSTDEPRFYAPARTAITPGPTLPWPEAATDLFQAFRSPSGWSWAFGK